MIKMNKMLNTNEYLIVVDDITDIEITENDTVVYYCSNIANIKTPRSSTATHMSKLCYSAECDNCYIGQFEEGLYIMCIFKNNTSISFVENRYLVHIVQLSNLLSSGYNMFINCENIKDIEKLKIPNNITNCDYMFAGCSTLTSIKDLELLNNLIFMTNMFCDSNIKYIDGLKIPPSVRYMDFAFARNPIKSIENFIVHDGVEDCSYLFRGCYGLDNVSGLHISNKIVKCMSIFEDCNMKWV